MSEVPLPDLQPEVIEYRAALQACALAKAILGQYDYLKLCNAIDRADSFGPMLDPTLWREKHGAMQEDRAVFEAALQFLRAFKKIGSQEPVG